MIVNKSRNVRIGEEQDMGWRNVDGFGQKNLEESKDLDLVCVKLT